MGAETSRLDDGADASPFSVPTSAPDPFNPYANVAHRKPKPVVCDSPTGSAVNSPTGGIGANRPGSAGGRPGSARPAGHVSAAKQRQLDQAAQPKVWMRSNQEKASTAVEVRKPRFPSASATRPLRSSAQTLESQMGALLKTEVLPEQPSLEQVMEEKKTEFIGKLSNFIGKGPAKLPADLALPKVAVLPPKQKPVPAATKVSWLNKLLASKAEIMANVKERLESGEAYEPMSQDGVGSEVEKSLGSTFDTFAGYQGTISNMMEEGLDDEFLEQFFMDEEAERQLTTYEKWAVIRNAAEQVLQVYANRSNARSIEGEQWTAPTVMDVRTGAAAVYQNTVDSALNQGLVALLFIDDGRLVETGEGTADISALLSTDLWQAVKELAPHKVPSGQRLERLSILGRHVLNATVSLELRYGPSALKSLKVVLAVDSEQEHFTVGELQKWNFFGLQSHNVVILPLPRFHGFAQDMKRGTLAHVRGSPRLMLGTGYSLFLLNSPGEAYTLDPSATSPSVLPGTVLDFLREHKANWLFSGLFSDVERLRPDAMLDSDFLAGAIYCADRQGANMAMDVLHCTSERDVRTYNSIVMGRKNADGSPGGACTLCASAMRTVRSYQLMQSQVASKEGFYVCTQRYAFKIAALQRMLTDTSNFHADVQLHGFFAYATLDIGDVTTFKDAHCACVMARGMPGPVMTDVVCTRNWLSYAAGVLEEQDKVDEFRQKAIDLIRFDKLNGSGPQIAGMPGAQSLRPGVSLEQRTSGRMSAAALSTCQTKFKERKQGLTVVLVLGSEHRAMAHNTTKLARLFICNIVDRLHVALILGSDEAERGAVGDLAKQVLDEVTDKELEFNGQLSREVIMRSGDAKIQDTINELLVAQSAGLVVVPSIKLCGAASLGSTMSSMAFVVAKSTHTIPVLVVKGNTSGRWNSVNPAMAQATAARDYLTAMAHLDSTAVAPMVEHISKVLTPEQDQLFLAKATAYERPGMLSMRSRRVFVQGRMAVTNELKVEERAYPGQPIAELTKAVEAESVDLLVVSVTGELPISKEIEELLKTAKTSIYIYRNKEVHSTVTQLASPLASTAEEQTSELGYNYGGSGASNEYYGAQHKFGSRRQP